MSWRPAPTVRNPLVALRRVVEAPEIEPFDAEIADPARAVGGATTRPTGSVSAFSPRLEAGTAPHPATAVRPAATPRGAATPLSGSSRAGARARRSRIRERAPRPIPDRPVRALITSTPVEHDRAAPNAPSSPPTGFATPVIAHAAAGPWSTLPEAPPSTPTLLRSSPGGPSGGSTATATGRSATVTNPVLRTIPAAAAPSRSPSRPPLQPTPAAGRPAAALRSTHALAPSREPTPTPVPPPTPTVAIVLARVTAVRKPMTVLQVTATMTAALLLWSLADAPALLHGAETSPLGTRRDAALAVLRPLDRVSAALGIDRLSHAADRLLHRHVAAGATKAPVAARTVQSPVAKTGPTKTPRVPTTVPRLPALRVGTAADPLRVLVIGDSIGLSFGESLANKLDGTGIVKTTIDGREGTGLSRPDAFDWPAELRADLARFRPEIVVAMFGGNDDQDTIINGRFIGFGSQAWTVIYGARVAALADATHGAGAHLLWSGIPVVRSAAKSQRLQSVMAVTEAALANRDGAVFVDNINALSDAAGHYADAITDAAGQTVIVREPDGIHVSPAGADRLADRATTEMASAWHLDLRPPTAPTPTEVRGAQ